MDLDKSGETGALFAAFGGQYLLTGQDSVSKAL